MMRISMNTALSGSGRIDSANALPSGELRGRTKLIKITEHSRADGARLGRQSTGLPEGRALWEINARQDVRRYAAEQSLSDEQALQTGMEQKAREFSNAGAEIYSKA